MNADEETFKTASPAAVRVVVDDTLRCFGVVADPEGTDNDKLCVRDVNGVLRGSEEEESEDGVVAGFGVVCCDVEPDDSAGEAGLGEGEAARMGEGTGRVSSRELL